MALASIDMNATDLAKHLRVSLDILKRLLMMKDIVQVGYYENAPYSLRCLCCFEWSQKGFNLFDSHLKTSKL